MTNRSTYTLLTTITTTTTTATTTTATFTSTKQVIQAERSTKILPFMIYDPWTGIGTAMALGSFLLLITGYIAYSSLRKTDDEKDDKYLQYYRKKYRIVAHAQAKAIALTIKKPDSSKKNLCKNHQESTIKSLLPFQPGQVTIARTSKLSEEQQTKESTITVDKHQIIDSSVCITEDPNIYQTPSNLHNVLVHCV